MTERVKAMERNLAEVREKLLNALAGDDHMAIVTSGELYYATLDVYNKMVKEDC